MSTRESMLDMVPIKAEGMDQKMTATAMKPSMKKRRMICSHHFIRNELQMISSGRMPIKRGDMCSGW